jgi:hypothetical protein
MASPTRVLRAAVRVGSYCTWEDEVHKKARKYLDNDNLSHLSGPDNEDLLAYLDFSLLLNLIEGQWGLFEPFLLPKEIWLGRCVEFVAIRNRIAHLRRPADRDLERVETTLADIEQGYRKAWRAVSTAVGPGDRPTDPVIQDYRRGEMHALIDRARLRYGRYALEFSLRISWMPWEKVPDPPDPLVRTPGLFWHLECGEPDIWVWPENYRDNLPPEVRQALAFTLTPSPMGAIGQMPGRRSVMLPRQLAHPCHAWPATPGPSVQVALQASLCYRLRPNLDPMSTRRNLAATGSPEQDSNPRLLPQCRLWLWGDRRLRGSA